MEKINRRFLNYKYYSKFLYDREHGGIPDDSDAIVFIQEGHRIWARGEEYVCSGYSGSSINNSTLNLIDSYGNVVFTISQRNGTIILTDSKGNTLSDSYIRTEDFNTLVRSAIRNKQDRLIPGRNISISDEEVIDCDIIIDDMMSEESTNPVQNRVIKTYLGLYVTQSTFEQALSLKQDNLIGRRGIDITGNIISCTLDTSVYVIIKSIDSVVDPNPNKIYILESEQEGNITYTQYRYDNGEWVVISSVVPTIDLTEVYQYIDSVYQRKGDYITQSVLNSNLQVALLRYASNSYVDETFVKKIDVYSGDIVNKISDPINEGVYTGGGNSNDPSGTTGSSIVLDNQLSYTSSNPVKNKVITKALDDYVKTTSMVTITAQRYQLLVENNLVEPNVYYFTYEGEEEGTWTFGDTFPIILTDEWTFGGTFPITLTDGNTPNGVGTFPINLT